MPADFLENDLESCSFDSFLVSAKGPWYDFLARALGESQSHPGCVATNLFPHFLTLLKTGWRLWWPRGKRRKDACQAV